jgi:hypothetical protein
MNKETVTGIIGALVLVAAMGGIFFYERSQLQEYTLGWVATEPTESARQGTLQHGAHHQHTFTGNVTTGLVAGVEVVLSWALHPGDGFGLLVTRPDGASVAQDQPGGTIRLGVPVQEAPENETVVERSAEGALKQGWGRLNETARSAGQGLYARLPRFDVGTGAAAAAALGGPFILRENALPWSAEDGALPCCATRGEAPDDHAGFAPC